MINHFGYIRYKQSVYDNFELVKVSIDLSYYEKIEIGDVVKLESKFPFLKFFYRYSDYDNSVVLETHIEKIALRDTFHVVEGIVETIGLFHDIRVVIENMNIKKVIFDSSLENLDVK